MNEHIKKYIDDVNKINEEIKAIKSADCIMDYNAKTEIINHKMSAIKQLDMMIQIITMENLYIAEDKQLQEKGKELL